MITFLLHIAVQTFRDYFKALAFLSYSFVIIFAAIIKYVVLTFRPAAYHDLKPFFQLSVFLFIPLFLFLIFTKFKREVLVKRASRQPQFSRWACVTAVIFMHIVLILLFSYIIVAQ